MALAFAAKLIPVEQPPAPEASPEPKAVPHKESKIDAPALPETNSVEFASVDQTPPPPGLKPEAARNTHERKDQPAEPTPLDRKKAANDTPAAEPARTAPQDARAVPSESPREGAAPPSRPAADTERTPAAPHTVMPQAVRDTQPNGPARDIRLEVASGDRRVEVRLMERAGEVHVAVRTPDAQLAGDLRANLPSLAARLEQSGMRAEPWHGGVDAATDRRTQAAPSSRSESGDTRERSHSQDHSQKDNQPRRARDFTAGGAQRKQKGTSFSWFMPSHT
jgi:hypothetical protein